MPLRAPRTDGATLSGNSEVAVGEEEETAAAAAARLRGSFFSISSSTWCSMTSLSSMLLEEEQQEEKLLEELKEEEQQQEPQQEEPLDGRRQGCAALRTEVPVRVCKQSGEQLIGSRRRETGYDAPDVVINPVLWPRVFGVDRNFGLGRILC